MGHRRTHKVTEGRFRLRWRLVAKLGLLSAVLAAAALAAVVIAVIAQAGANAMSARLDVERPLTRIVGRLEARQEQIASLLSPRVRADPAAVQEATRAAGRDVLDALQIVARPAGPAGGALAEVDAGLAMLVRDYQDLEREAAGTGALQKAAAVRERLASVRRAVEALAAPAPGPSPRLLASAAAALGAAAALCAAAMIALAAGIGRRARRLGRSIDEMTFRVRSGEPPFPPDAPEASDEIGYLALSLGRLAGSLQGSLTRSQRLASDLATAASHDSLTGALSRIELNGALEAELARYQRYKGPLSVILFNVDHLGRINEQEGSDVGDYVLSTIANLVRFNVRKTDTFARWGGDEFALLLTETSMDGARHLAEKLRRNIEVHPFDKAGTVTVSVGVTELAAGDTRDSFVGRAEDAMHRARTRGRNRVVAASAPASQEEAAAVGAKQV